MQIAQSEVMETGRRRRQKRGYTEMGKQIKKGMIDKGITAKELADMLGIRPQYINKIIHGDRSGSKYMDEIRRILEIAA